MDSSIADGITVTTATRTPEQVRASLGVAPPPEKPVEPTKGADDPKPVTPDAAAAPVAIDPELEAEIDRLEPPKPDETAEQRTERRSRSSKKILKEISLRKAAEDRAERLERENADLRRPKPAPAPTPGDAPKPGDPAAPAAPEFRFPTWEEYSAKHPEAEYHEYTDARTDARFAFNQKKDQDERQRAQAVEHLRGQFAELQRHEAAFMADHADYDAVVGAVKLGNADPELVADLQRLIARAGKAGPEVLYYLGHHPDEATRLLQAPRRSALVETFGEIKYAATHQAPAAAAPAAVVEPPKPPAKPATSAPAPIGEVRGAAQNTRSLSQLAADDDDADAYIAVREKQLRKAG